MSTTDNPSVRVPRRLADLWLRKEGAENAVIDPASGNLHILNETAVALWELCDGRTLPREMVDAICQLFDAPRAQVEIDVERTLADFERRRLIEWTGVTQVTRPE